MDKGGHLSRVDSAAELAEIADVWQYLPELASVDSEVLVGDYHDPYASYTAQASGAKMYLGSFEFSSPEHVFQLTFSSTYMESIMAMDPDKSCFGLRRSASDPALLETVALSCLEPR